MTLFSRKNISIISTKLSPAKCKYKFERTDNGYTLVSEFEPDVGVALVSDGDYVSFTTSNGDKFSSFEEEWYGDANIRNMDGSSMPYAEWIAKRE
jgi:hypothetical protein